MLIKMDREKCHIFAYDGQEDEYVKAVTIPNPIALKYGLNERKAKQIMAKSILEMLGNTEGVKEELEKWANTEDDGFVEVPKDGMPWQ